MTRTVYVRPSAERELARAVRWYEREREGLGEEFLETALEFLKKVGRSPNSRSVFSELPARLAAKGVTVRNGRVPRFPFRVAYVVDKRFVVVVAIVHAKRGSAYWRRRLADEL